MKIEIILKNKPEISQSTAVISNFQSLISNPFQDFFACALVSGTFSCQAVFNDHLKLTLELRISTEKVKYKVHRVHFHRYFGFRVSEEPEKLVKQFAFAVRNLGKSLKNIAQVALRGRIGTIHKSVDELRVKGQKRCKMIVGDVCQQPRTVLRKGIIGAVAERDQFIDRTFGFSCNPRKLLVIPVGSERKNDLIGRHGDI